MSRATAVVFDIGNILIRWEPEVVLGDYFADAAALAAFRRETRIDWVNLDLDAGVPFADGLGALVARFPQHADAIHAFNHRWPEMVTGAIDANVATLRALKTAGHPVHAITNFSREKFDIARRVHPFLNEFGHTLVSADVRLIKPDYRIYHRFCRDTGLEPEQIIFVDDSAVNIAAAKAVGFQTFHMPHADEAECAAFRQTLRQHGFSV
jgi:2-haloacid dehalogenase